MTPPIAFRPATDADLPMVMSDWMRSFRKAQFDGGLKPLVFQAAMLGLRVMVQSLIAEGVATVAVAPDEPTEAYGWVVFGPPLLHYVYVKDIWRRKGVGGALLSVAGYRDGTLRCTHMTSAFRAAFGRTRELEIINPYELFRRTA